jgi:hypothetical protein
MYGQNGPLRSVKRTSKLAIWREFAKDARMNLLLLPPPVRLAIVLTLIALLAVCAGCGTTSTPPDTMPRNPEPPPTRLSPRSESYSSSAAKLLEQWRAKLIELTTKPSN